LGRFTSLPRTVVAALGIGVLEQLALWNSTTGGIADLCLVIVLLVALLVQSRQVREEASSWLLTTIVRPAPRRLADIAWLRRLGPALALVAFAAAALLPIGMSNAQTLTATTIVAYAILALSTTLIIGVAGQVSLGQVAFFGLGAAVSFQLSVHTGLPFWMDLVAAGVIGGLASVIMGIPALRVRGLFFAVTTLGFAVVVPGWLLSRPWLLGTGATAPRPFFGSFDLAHQRPYYELALAGLAIAVLVSRNLLAGGVGRRLLAVRENEKGAAAFGLRVTRTKVLAFAVAGFLAGFGGAIYGHGVQHFNVNDFPVADGLRVVSMVVIGGLGSIPGAIIGAVFVLGADRVVDTPVMRLLTTSLGLLILLLVLPGGLVEGIYAVRDRIWRRFAA
jgi:ABC-type branched-subunit amino acid transport system permease subunit